MSYETILYEVEDELATITINRPHRANTISPQLTTDMGAALADASDRDDVRALIITGAGRHFCGGADLKEAQSFSPTRERHPERLQLFWELERLAKPVIAAINGAAMGGGCELALMCDLRVMASDALIGTPEIKFGALPAGGGTQRLARYVGIGVAKELVLLGEPISAERAYNLGLVNSVVPREEVMDEAQRLGRILALRADFALATGKELVQRSVDLDLRSGLIWERDAISNMATEEEKIAERDRAAQTQDTYRRIFADR